MLPETYDYLGDFADGQRVNRIAIGRSCVTLLTGDLVTSEDEIDTKALWHQDVGRQLFGTPPSDEVEREALGVLAPLLTLNPDGRVQEALEPPLVLCAKTVRRSFTNGDGEVTVSRRAKFVTDDMELARIYNGLPAVEQWTDQGVAVNKRLTMLTDRHPQLASARRTMLLDARGRLAAELPEITSGS